MTPANIRSWDLARPTSPRHSATALERNAMTLRWDPREHLSLAKYAVKWLLIAAPVSAAIGSACALFLWSLDWATRTRWRHPQLLFFLPLAGLTIALLYRFVGKNSEAGTNL